MGRPSRGAGGVRGGSERLWGLMPAASPLTEFPMRMSAQVVFVRSAGALRTLWALLVLVTVAGPSFIEPMPRAALPVVVATVAWSGFVLWLALHEGFPARSVSWFDVAIFAALLVGEASLVPATLVGDGTSWVFAGASVAVLIASMLLSTAEAMAVTVMLICAYLAGIASAGESIFAPDGVPTSFVLLVQGVLDAAAVRALRRSADSADEALTSQMASKRTIIVEENKAHEREAQVRLLHDKVRSTLWLIGDGHLLARRDTAMRSCEESLAALRDLRQGRIEDEMAYSVPHAVGTVVERARLTGQTVRYDAPADEAASAGRDDQADTDHGIPEVVCEAIRDATRQALANVLRHVRTGAAHVEVVSSPGCVQVTVTDQGSGFDPTSREGRGIRSSMIGRMSEVGGTVEFRSTPDGTTVILGWDAALNPVPNQPQDEISALRFYGNASLRILAAAGLVFQTLALYAAFHFASDYAFPWMAPAAWAAQWAAGITLVAGFGRRRLRPAAVWICVAVIVAGATVVVLDCQTRGALGFANWAFGTTVWPLAFSAAYLPVRRVALLVAFNDVVQTSIIAAKLGANLPGLLKLSAILMENAMLQAGFAVAFVILTNTTSVTATAVWQAGISRATLYADQIARRSRAIRATRIDEEVYALLESVSSGILDPNDTETRRRFDAAGQAMRREDTLATIKADITDLSVILEQAAAAGIDLEILLADRYATFPVPVRLSMTAALVSTLRFAAPGKGRIVLHDHADLTSRNWQEDFREKHRDVYSMTLMFTMRATDTAALQKVVESFHLPEGAPLVLDVDIDSEDAVEPGTAFAWLTAASR